MVSKKKRRGTLPETSFPVFPAGGGKVTVWGCITSRGVGHLHRIIGTMDAKMYRDILEESLLGTLHDHRLSPKTIIFQHDNDPKHKPSSSPDFNIIENIWAHIKMRLERYRPRPRNVEALWRVVQKLWYEVDISFIQALYHSLPGRVKTVKGRKGGNGDS
ncbi:hypothetical protein NUW54_g14220 [Trametes sanguinea]|uniref:Uncharacterized protein n=1 Tax=Trametes sanguinea TaxID=158606 RepID=A0ACC1MEJ1_9APHY|nr:hypothetical protein NUW54_g14220 [Trametes sanguinea]